MTKTIKNTPKVLGLDISTKTIGWSLFDIQKEELLELTHISPRPKMVKGDEIVSKKIEQAALKTFEDEKAKRRFINSINKGFAFNLGELYEELNEYVDKINPELSQLYAASQAIMEHLYWLYPDLQQMASGGGGQLAQHEITKPDGSKESSNDEEEGGDEGSNENEMSNQQGGEEQGGEEQGPYTIEAYAPTLPLLIHELLLGVAKYFSWLGGIQGKEKSELI